MAPTTETSPAVVVSVDKGSAIEDKSSTGKKSSGRVVLFLAIATTLGVIAGAGLRPFVLPCTHAPELPDECMTSSGDNEACPDASVELDGPDGERLHAHFARTGDCTELVEEEIELEKQLESDDHRKLATRTYPWTKWITMYWNNNLRNLENVINQNAPDDLSAVQLVAWQYWPRGYFRVQLKVRRDLSIAGYESGREHWYNIWRRNKRPYKVSTVPWNTYTRSYRRAVEAGTCKAEGTLYLSRGLHVLMICGGGQTQAQAKAQAEAEAEAKALAQAKP